MHGFTNVKVAHNFFKTSYTNTHKQYKKTKQQYIIIIIIIIIRKIRFLERTQRLEGWVSHKNPLDIFGKRIFVAPASEIEPSSFGRLNV